LGSAGCVFDVGVFELLEFELEFSVLENLQPTATAARSNSEATAFLPLIDTGFHSPF
jgi:hypothetical protein